MVQNQECLIYISAIVEAKIFSEHSIIFNFWWCLWPHLIETNTKFRWITCKIISLRFQRLFVRWSCQVEGTLACHVALSGERIENRSLGHLGQPQLHHYTTTPLPFLSKSININSYHVSDCRPARVVEVGQPQLCQYPPSLPQHKHLMLIVSWC